jgi:hypothetical protein
VCLSGRVLWYARMRAREWSAVLGDVVVSVSFTSPGRLGLRADCCWVRGGTFGVVVLLVWKRRREEGGLIVVSGRRRRRGADQQGERRPRRARRAPSISSFIAHFRHDARELNSAKDFKHCGVETSLTVLTAGQGLLAWDLSSNHDQEHTHHPAATRLQCSLFCRYHVPASRAPMAMLESLLLRMHGGRTRTALQ